MRLISSVMILTYSAACFFFAAMPLHAQTPDPNALESLTQAEAQARAKNATLTKERLSVLREITKLKKSLQSSAKETRAFERENLKLQTRLEDITARQNILKASLAQSEGQMMQLLAALQRLETIPNFAAPPSPDEAIKAAQSQQLIRGISENLQNRADTLASTLSAYGQTRSEITAQQIQRRQNQAELETRRQITKRQVEQKAKLQKSIEADRALSLAEVERLAAESQNLRELIERFENEVANIGPRIKPRKGDKPRDTASRKSQPVKPITRPKGTVSFAKAKGLMTRPITGPLLRNYGNGEKGLTYKGTSTGQVLAPYAGRVEFSGPFKNYEQVVILNVGDGYFILLTGLGDVFSEAGDNVRLGEPVGTLPLTSGKYPNLYIELRKNGKPINPAPWFEPRAAKTG